MDESDRSKKNLTANITRSDFPEFEVHNLKPGRIYGALLYASNVLGQGRTLRLNITTAELTEKRTAETKVAAVGDEAAVDKASSPDTSSSSAAATSDRTEGNELALLPIITILCGVAVGLATLALGVIFLVRGRSEDSNAPSSDNEDNGNASVIVSSGGAKSGGGGGSGRSGRKYESVATEDDLIAEKQLCPGVNGGGGE